MSRILQIVSDVHLEHRGALTADALPETLGDILVLAGDIGNVHEGSLQLQLYIAAAAAKWKHVLYVPGNHEYYGANRKSVDKALKRITDEHENVHLLNNSTVTIDGQRYVGSTLWSSPAPSSRLNDFEKIYSSTMCEDDGAMKKLSRKEFSAWNESAKSFLGATVKEDDIVITHFLPLMNEELKLFGVETRYPVDPVIDTYFGNRGLWSPMSRAKLWISGHTHQEFDGRYRIHPSTRPTRWVCNPLGYPGENVSPNVNGIIVDSANVLGEEVA